MPPTEVSFYAILELAPTCTEKDIKKAYRRLSLLHHPDKSSDSTASERFRQIHAAYHVLSDPIKRVEYDQRHRLSAPKPSDHAPPPTQRGYRDASFDTLEIFMTDGFALNEFAEYTRKACRRTTPNKDVPPNVEEYTVSVMDILSQPKDTDAYHSLHHLRREADKG
ncbi:hypothetical protein MNV49_006034 [Pseudohyphozyma bogoriensis]|nr:hypothetical protein MNV49_006034 [Pseudohyphozyma bogoriensis]